MAGDGSHAGLLANHGPVVAGNDLESAIYATEELEETARLYLMLRHERVRLLTEAQIAANPRQAATPGDFSHISGGYGNLGGDLMVGDAQLAMNAGYRGKQANSAFFVATSFRNNISTQVTVASFTPRAQLPFTTGAIRHSLVTGVDWDDWDFDQTASAFASHSLATQRDKAFYVQDTLSIGDATVISIGGRAQTTSYNLSEIVGGSSAVQQRNLHAYQIAGRRKLTDNCLVTLGRFQFQFMTHATYVRNVAMWANVK